MFSRNFVSIIGVKMKLRIERKKYAVDSEIEFPKKSILRTMIITETTRQLESSNFDFFESKKIEKVQII